MNGNKKLNIVFDLDNTCIYSRILDYQYVKEVRKKYPEKEIIVYSLKEMNNNHNKIFYHILLLGNMLIYLIHNHFLYLFFPFLSILYYYF